MTVPGFSFNLVMTLIILKKSNNEFVLKISLESVTHIFH